MPDAVDFKKAAGFAPMIKFEGLFDWDELYKMMHDWLTTRKYIFQEIHYKHAGEAGIGAESEVRFEGSKKETAYIKFVINIDVHIWGLQEVEVIKDGQKKKMSKGRIRIEVWGQIVYDYQGKFDTSKFLQRVRSFYHRYVAIDEHAVLYEDKLYYYVYKLHADLKSFLGMEGDENVFDQW